MCGRFNVVDNPGLQMLMDALGVQQPLPQAVNIAPTESVPLVRIGEQGPRLDPARWWLTPAWAPRVEQKYSMFNARCESLATSRAFRRPFASQRGIVPMSSFIEWRQEGAVKQPWLISSEEGGLAVAALWDLWHGDEQPLLSCTLVTREAPASFEPWHRRMPVLLAPEDRARWMDNRHALSVDDPLFQGGLPTALILAPLSRAVGNARNKDPQLMEPVGEPVRLDAERG